MSRVWYQSSPATARRAARFGRWSRTLGFQIVPRFAAFAIPTTALCALPPAGRALYLYRVQREHPATRLWERDDEQL
jgi:hypothetical protein